MADDDWISAREAVELLKPVMGGEYSAQMTICERANDGLIRSRAARLVLGDKERDDVELLRPFWRHRGGNALKQNWITGDFEMWSDRDTHCRAYGVQFSREDIMKMVPASSSAAKQPDAQASGTKIFIGHGHSLAWRELKDFITDRLKLPYDEFNATSAAGISTVARLEEMLNNAVFAFLVFTAEDERADGEMQARMNVVHEAGLFQGHLGFSKAIILFEDGCKDFSNVHGLGHIRFPRGSIKLAFEEVRRVLEREEIIKPS